MRRHLSETEARRLAALREAGELGSGGVSGVDPRSGAPAPRARRAEVTSALQRSSG